MIKKYEAYLPFLLLDGVNIIEKFLINSKHKFSDPIIIKTTLSNFHTDKKVQRNWAKKANNSDKIFKFFAGNN